MTPAEWNGAVARTLEAAAAAASHAKTNGHPPPPVKLPAPDDLKPQPGEVFSPSQVGTFLACPAKWMFRYHLGLPDPPNGPRHIGACLHKASEFNFRHQLDRGAPPDLASVIGSYDLAWEDRAAEVEWRDKEDPSQERQLGRELVEVLHRGVWSSIEPAAVEVPVEGAIAGVPVRGFIDLLDVHGRVIDFKSASKSPSGIRPDYRLQATTYDLLLSPQSRGVAALYTITKTKTIKVVPQSFEIGPADVQYAEAIYPMVRDAISDGLFYPRRDSHLCSRSWCAYWRECEAEFGGEVAQ